MLIPGLRGHPGDGLRGSGLAKTEETSGNSPGCDGLRMI